MAVSRPRRIFTRRRRFPWIVTALMVVAAAEISYVVYSQVGNAAPGCSAGDVQSQLSRLVEGTVRDERAGPVEVRQIEEVDKRRSGRITVMRECLAEASIDNMTTQVIYEIRPDGPSSGYQVVLSEL